MPVRSSTGETEIRYLRPPGALDEVTEDEVADTQILPECPGKALVARALRFKEPAEPAVEEARLRASDTRSIREPGRNGVRVEELLNGCRAASAWSPEELVSPDHRLCPVICVVAQPCVELRER